jgi:hypothetical protein
VDYLDEVRQLSQAVDSIQKSIYRQAEELQPFIEGRRRSKYPLGKKLLLNVAQQVDELLRRLEVILKEERK